MLDPGEVFFFEQTTRWRPPKRSRKLPDELPQSMKFAHLNRSAQAYLQNREQNDGAGFASADGGGEAPRVAFAKEVSLLPDISHAVGLLKSHLDVADGTSGGGGDFTRVQFNEFRAAASGLLEVLSRWLALLQQQQQQQQSGRRLLQLPRSLEHQLQCCYEELCAGALLPPPRREWQLQSNAVAAAARKAERVKADGESLAKGDGPADGGGGGSSGLGLASGQQQQQSSQLTVDDDASSTRRAPGRDDPDSDGDGGRDGKVSVATMATSSGGQSAGTAVAGVASGGRGGARHRQLAAAAGDDKSSRGNSRRSHSDVRRRLTTTAVVTSTRRPTVTPSATAIEARQPMAGGSHRGDDAASSVGTPSSAKSTIGPQPYSVTVLQFNLTNVKALEDRGCKVFGMDGGDGFGKDAQALSPLEWAVRRLSIASRAIHAESLTESGGGVRCVPFVRHYGDKIVSDKQIEKSYSERLGVYSALIRGEPIRVPPLPSSKASPAVGPPRGAAGGGGGSGGRQAAMMVQTSDGSQCAFYETGRVALATSPAASGSGGFYSMAFDEAQPPHMVACFTPLGHGSCHYASGALRYVSTEDGGTLYDESGECVERFRWPAANGGKLSNPITFALSRCLSMRILGQHQVYLVFSSGSFTLKVSVSKAEKATAVNMTEAPLLQTFEGEYDFESDYAIDLINQQRALRSQQAAVSEKKPDKKLVFKLKASASISRKSDVKVVDNEVDFLKLEKDLDRLKAKSRLLIDDWMETYRIATGMMSPHISRLREGGVAAMLKSSGAHGGRLGGAALSHSAKSTPGSFLPSAVVADEDSTSPIPIVTEEERRRVPSAPGNVSMWSPRQGGGEEEVSRKRDGQTVQFDGSVVYTDTLDNGPAAANGDAAGQTTTPRQQPQVQTQVVVSPVHQAKNTAWSNGSFAPWAAPPRGQCPVALRLELMGRGAMPCRCQRRKMPYITDVEFDEFIHKTAPPRQLVVVAVTSSLITDEKSASMLDMLERMHADRNAHRAMPCLQSRSDPFRVFRYDLSTAHFDTGRKQALLAERHGASSGMFLIYESGRLLFCDRVFNGYSSNARSDFQKQLAECRRLAVAGCNLPADFKFSSARRRRSGGSTKLAELADGGSGDRFLIPLGLKGSEATAAHSFSAVTPAPVEYSMGVQADEAPALHRVRKPHHDTITARLLAVKVNQSAPPQQRLYKGSAHSAR